MNARAIELDFDVMWQIFFYVQFIKMSIGIPEMSLAAIVWTYIYNNRVFSPIFFMKTDCDS